MILKLLDGEDKNIFQFFLHQMFEINNKIHETHMNLKGEFERWKTIHKNNYDYYNILEKRLVALEEITEQEG